MLDVIQIARKLSRIFFAQTIGLYTVQNQNDIGRYAATVDVVHTNPNKKDVLVDLVTNSSPLNHLN